MSEVRRRRRRELELDLRRALEERDRDRAFEASASLVRFDATWRDAADLPDDRKTA